MAAASKAGIVAGKAFVVIEALDGTPAVLRSIQGRIMRWATNLQAIGQRIFMRALASSLPSVISMRTFQNFDDAMRRVEAHAEGSSDQLEMLRNQARELGMAGAFSATQIANLMDKLATRGFNREQIHQMTQAVLDAARAAGEGDLGRDVLNAGDAVSDALNIFQLGAEQAGMVADLLTMAANDSKFSLEDLQIALATTGPIAFQYNATLMETLALLETMRDVGIDASVAGTGLRNMFLKASDTKARDEFNRQLKAATGNIVQFTDANSDLRKMSDILFDIDAAMEGLGTAARGDLLRELFGLRAITPAAAAMSGSASFTRHLENLQQSAGLAHRQALQMEAGVGGVFRTFLRGVESLALTLAEIFEKATISLKDSIAKVFMSINDWLKANDELIIQIHLVIAGFLIYGATLFLVGASIKTAMALLTPFILATMLLRRSIILISRAVVVVLPIIGMLASTFIKVAMTIGSMVIPAIMMYIKAMYFVMFNAMMVFATLILGWFKLFMIINTIAVNGIMRLAPTIMSIGTFILNWMIQTLGAVVALFYTVLAAGIFVIVDSMIIGWLTAKSIAFFVIGASWGLALMAGFFSLLIALPGLILGFIGRAISATVNVITSAATTIWGAISNTVSKIFNFILKHASMIIDTIKQVIKGVTAALKSGDMELAFKIGTLGARILWSQLVNFMLTAWEEMVLAFKGTFHKLLVFLTKGLHKFAVILDAMVDAAAALGGNEYTPSTFGQTVTNMLADLELNPPTDQLPWERQIRQKLRQQAIDRLNRELALLVDLAGSPIGKKPNTSPGFGGPNLKGRTAALAGNATISPVSAIEALQEGTMEAAKQFYENMRNREKSERDKMLKVEEEQLAELRDLNHNVEGIGAGGPPVIINNV